MTCSRSYGYYILYIKDRNDWQFNKDASARDRDNASDYCVNAVPWLGPMIARKETLHMVINF